MYRWFALMIAAGLLLMGIPNAQATETELNITIKSIYDTKGCKLIDMRGPLGRGSDRHYEVYKLCRGKTYADEYVLFYNIPVVSPK